MHILSGKKNSKIRLFPALAIMPLFFLFCYQVPVSVNQPLDAPTGVTAIAVSESSINVSWNDIAQDVEGFIVERSATGGTAAADWTAVNDADTNIYNDSNLSPQTNYFYRVMAYSGNIKSNYSAVVNATTQAIGTPAAPSGFTAAVLSSSSIRLTWTDNSNNETGFILEYSTGNANWTQLTSSNVTTYDHTGCTAGTLYYYRVRAYNGAGQSTDVTVSATTQQVIPVAPSNLSASVQSSSRIILTWADNSSNEQGFILEYSINQTNWTQLTSANVTTYDHTGLTAYTTYYYRVRAYNIAGYSANAIANAKTQQPPIVNSTIIIDHTSVELFDSIPSQYLNAAKNMLVWIVGESHSMQIPAGLERLEAVYSDYNVHVATGDITQLSDSNTLRVYRGHKNRWSWSEYGLGDESFWSVAQNLNEHEATGRGIPPYTVKGANDIGMPIHLVLWCWCWDIAGANNVHAEDGNMKTFDDERFNKYMEVIRSFNNNPEINQTKFIFQTSVSDANVDEYGWNVTRYNQMMREDIKTNGGVLFDQADIENWNINNTEQRMEMWNGHILYLRHNSYAVEDAGHASYVLCEKKAKAFWVMLARIAGWDGNITK